MRKKKGSIGFFRKKLMLSLFSLFQSSPRSESPRRASRPGTARCPACAARGSSGPGPRASARAPGGAPGRGRQQRLRRQRRATETKSKRRCRFRRPAAVAASSRTGAAAAAAAVAADAGAAAASTSRREPAQLVRRRRSLPPRPRRACGARFRRRAFD